MGALPALRRQVSTRAVRDLSRQTHGFAQRRMRVDGLADVHGIRAHLDRERELADHVAGVGADEVDIGKTIHPHPTLGESIGMAAEIAHGTCTDVPPQRKPT